MVQPFEVRCYWMPAEALPGELPDIDMGKVAEAIAEVARQREQRLLFMLGAWQQPAAPRFLWRARE